MKSKHFFRFCLFLFLVSFSLSCSKEGGTTDTFIPDLSQNWKNTSTADDDQYFFQVDNEGAPSSTFTGNESNNTTGENFQFSGSYQNSKIQFTFTSGSKNGTKYSGTVSGTTNPIMTLTTPSGTIVLERQ